MEASKNQNRMKKNTRGNLNYNPSENNLDTHAGLLNPLPPPPSRSVSMSFFYPQNQQQKPPLLPLPHVSTTTMHLRPLISRSLNSQGFSLPPQKNKNRTKDLSLTPKKSKQKKRDETKRRSSGTQSISDNNRWGPDPKDLPKHLPVVLRPGKEFAMDLSSESVFNLSPPPSSLPLPKFSLRSKLSCTAEAAGSVDTGATINLRRLLRLR